MDSSILDREPLCGRSLSDTLSHIRRRGYFEDERVDADHHKTRHFKPANIGNISKAKLQEITGWDVDEVWPFHTVFCMKFNARKCAK